MPIITERDGIANYVDLVESVSMREAVDEATGISSKVVIDWKQQPKGGDLKPAIVLRNAKGDTLYLSSGREARCRCRPMPSSRSRMEVHAGDVLARIRVKLEDP